MEARYLRNLPALSEQECRLLRTKRILVVGCGGLGGYIIEMLARIGVGSIRAVDGDSFEESNLNRQLLSAPGRLGCSKAQAVGERIAEINPDVAAEVFCTFLDNNNAAGLVSGCDIVIDALDNIDSRRVLAAACAEKGLPLVFGAISGWLAQAAISMPGDGFVERLYPPDVEIKDKSALSFTPALCAAMQCSLAVRWLCGREVKSGTLYYLDLMNMEFETIELV